MKLPSFLRPLYSVLSLSLVGWVAALMPTAHAASEKASSEPLASIASLDVPRYAGTWYEIAKYPNRFQKQCVGSTRAEYTVLGEGRVQVTNRCKTASGAMTEAVGEARQVGSSTSARLQVRFAPAWLSFLPMVWGDYWVIDLDDAYDLVAVSEPGREYLWILSRTPQVDAARYAALTRRLEQKGFDLTRLEQTRHD